MAEAPEQYKRPVQPGPKLKKDVVEKLLREKSNRVIITRVEDRKKRSECWKFFGFPKVDGVTYEDMAVCHKCFTIYKYSSSKGNAQLNKHVCPKDMLKRVKGQSTLDFLGKSKVGSSQSTSQVKLSKHDHQSLQINAINAAALDSSPLSRYEKEGMKIMFRTAARFGARYGENFDLAQHIVDRTNLTRNYLPKRHEDVRADILKSLNGDAFCTTTDLWKEKYTGKSYMSVTVHHIDTDWNNLSSFIWSTTEYNLEDHRAPSISKCYLENVPEAPFRLVTTDNTNTMPAAFRLLDSDDQIGCISHISSLVAKACVTSDEAAEVKLNVEAAKKLVEHVKRTDLQNFVCFKPLHDCGLELEKDKEPTLHRAHYWEAKLQAAFSVHEQDMTAIRKMKEVGRKALLTKLSSRLNVYHDVASALDPRVGEPTDEDSRRKICEKIENVHDRITGVDGDETRDDNDHSLLSDGEDSEEVSEIKSPHSEKEEESL
ncbi:zinc finger BED domain-containing 1-like [Paramuricea clavata]|uniref:Zinc finger BED domain-containing 1-like n=1 Tax=Paramuricea clavata TaxID=317549 RepID=A0A7D9HGN8_PARCT|nr:zinc finger BED domain-containing 1-like [Paramuricea clavata]